MVRPVRDLLAKTALDIAYESLPPHVVHHANRCVLDLIGVACGGCETGASPMAREVMESLGGPGEGGVFGGSVKLPAPHAAMVNAVSGHALDMDDGHRLANAHIGVVTIPTALALAQRDGLSARDFLVSVVAGYEVMIRLGAALNPGLLHQGFHSTAVFGTFASAAVAGRLLNLDSARMKNAFSLAALHGSGLLEALEHGQMSKPYQVGNAVQSGMMAALMAQKGVEGPETVFEGKNGFFKAYGNLAFNKDRYYADPGHRIGSVYFKTHAACRHIHAAIDGAGQIIERENISPENIDAIDVETYTVAHRLVAKNTGQKSALAAKFSLPVSLGLALVKGSAGPGDYNADSVGDARVQALAKKVRVTVTEEWDEAFPARRGAKVIIKTADQVYSQKVDYALGEPENPLSDEALLAKFTHNLGQTADKGEIRELGGRILGLPSGSITEIMSFLTSGKK